MADKKPMSEAKKAANKKWNDANLKDKYDRIQLVVPKGGKDMIKAAADQAGESVSAYIVAAVRERMEREGAGFCISTPLVIRNSMKSACSTHNA